MLSVVIQSVLLFRGSIARSLQVFDNVLHWIQIISFVCRIFCSIWNGKINAYAAVNVLSWPFFFSYSFLYVFFVECLSVCDFVRILFWIHALAVRWSRKNSLNVPMFHYSVYIKCNKDSTDKYGCDVDCVLLFTAFGNYSISYWFRSCIEEHFAFTKHECRATAQQYRMCRYLFHLIRLIHTTKINKIPINMERQREGESEITNDENVYADRKFPTIIITHEYILIWRCVHVWYLFMHL